jgi:hypothetical protein
VKLGFIMHLKERRLFHSRVCAAPLGLGQVACRATGRPRAQQVQKCATMATAVPPSCAFLKPRKISTTKIITCKYRTADRRGSPACPHRPRSLSPTGAHTAAGSPAGSSRCIAWPAPQTGSQAVACRSLATNQIFTKTAVRPPLPTCSVLLLQPFQRCLLLPHHGREAVLSPRGLRDAASRPLD